MTKSLAPGSIIGIVGGGQLGRMTALAAYQMGYKVHILTDEADAPAAQIAPSTVAPADDLKAAASFAENVDVVTFEFEKVPPSLLKALAVADLRPSARCLELGQNRILEKQFIEKCGFKPADWRPVKTAADLQGLQSPFILKHALFGYDGKGQEKITHPSRAKKALEGDGPWVAERVVHFDKELSCIVARTADGDTTAFEVGWNIHRNHILHSTELPAKISPALAKKAEAITISLAEKMGLVGLLAVEFFKEGEDLLVNEFAPRPHNSGHWTLDGAICSQFEQLVRAVCGLPLGSARRLTDIKMTNLLGDEAADPRPRLQDPATKFWSYGKRPRPLRKVGHLNELRLGSGK